MITIYDGEGVYNAKCCFNEIIRSFFLGGGKGGVSKWDSISDEYVRRFCFPLLFFSSLISLFSYYLLRSHMVHFKSPRHTYYKIIILYRQKAI